VIPLPIRKYPKTLKLGDETYRIRFVRRFEDKDTLGECDPEAKEIRLKLGQGREETFKTLIHEICHGLLEFEHDLKVKHKLIYGMEQAIYQFLTENF
jgi:hypothetical protein